MAGPTKTKVLFIKHAVMPQSAGANAGVSYGAGEVRNIDSTLATTLINAKVAIPWDATTFNHPNMPQYLFVNTINQNI